MADPAAPLLPLTHMTRARSLRGVVVLGAVWGAALALWLALNAHPVIAALVAAAALPLAWDIARNRAAWFEVTHDSIAWSTGGASRRLALSQVVRADLMIRMDLSSKLTLYLHNGSNLRLPPACLPPAHPLEAALMAANVPVTRRFFALS
jgi:hypothetical protein